MKVRVQHGRIYSLFIPRVIRNKEIKENINQAETYLTYNIIAFYVQN